MEGQCGRLQVGDRVLSIHEFYTEIWKLVTSGFKSTQVVVVPHLEDIASLHPLPQPSWADEFKAFAAKILFLSNPSQLQRMLDAMVILTKSDPSILVIHDESATIRARDSDGASNRGSTNGPYQRTTSMILRWSWMKVQSIRTAAGVSASMSRIVMMVGLAQSEGW